MHNMEIHEDLTDQVNSLCALIEKLKPSSDVMEDMIKIDENSIKYHYMMLLFLIYRIKPENKLRNIYNQVLGFDVEPFMDQLLQRFQGFNDQLVETQRDLLSLTRREFNQQLFPRYKKIFTDEEREDLREKFGENITTETVESIAQQFSQNKQVLKKSPQKKKPGLIDPLKLNLDNKKNILNQPIKSEVLNESKSVEHLIEENQNPTDQTSENLASVVALPQYKPDKEQKEQKKKITFSERENLFLKFVPLRSPFEISQQLIKSNMLKKFKPCEKIWRSKTPLDSESKYCSQYIRAQYNNIQRSDKFKKFYKENETQKELNVQGSKLFQAMCQNWKKQRVYCSEYLKKQQRFKNFLFEDNQEVIDVQQNKFSNVVFKSQSLPFRKSYYDPEKRQQDQLVVYLQRINIFKDVGPKETKVKDLESIQKKFVIQRKTKNLPNKSALKHHKLNKFHSFNPKLQKVNVQDYNFKEKQKQKTIEQQCFYESASDSEFDYKVFKFKKRYDSQRYAVIQSLQTLTKVNADSIQDYPLEKLQRMLNSQVSIQSLQDQSLNQYQSIMHAQKVIFIQSTIQSSTLLPLFLNNRKEFVMDDSFKIGQQNYEQILQSEVQRMRPELAKILETIPQPILRNEPDLSENKLKEEFLFSSEYDKLRKKEKLKFKSLRIQKLEEKKMQKEDQKEKVMKISENQKMKQQKQLERKPLQIPVDIYQLFLLQLSLNTIVKHDHVFNYEKRLLQKQFGVIKSKQGLIPLPTLDNMVFVKAMQIFTKQFHRETQNILVMAKQQLYEELKLKCNALKEINAQYDNDMVLIYLTAERMVRVSKYQLNLNLLQQISWEENNVEKVMAKRRLEEELRLADELKQQQFQKQEAERLQKQKIHDEKQQQLKSITKMPMSPIDSQELLLIWYNLHQRISRRDFDEFLAGLDFDQQMVLKVKLLNQNFSVEVLRNQIKSNNQIQRFVTEDAQKYLKETKPIYRFYDLYQNSIQAESNCGIAQFCKGCTSTLQFYNRGMIRIIKELDREDQEEDMKLIKVRYSPIRERQQKMKLRLLEQPETEIKPSQQLIDAIQSGNPEMLMTVVESHQESRLIEEIRRPAVKSQLKSRLKRLEESNIKTSVNQSQSQFRQPQVKPLPTRPISELELKCLKIPKSALKTMRPQKVEVEKPMRLITQSVLKREKPNVNYAQMKYEEELNRSDVNLMLMIKK
uniref:Uncharacterized protein n=1 Tax=Trepomonas sp. PC1 TaxID=1076344 RepID=A0A146K228_9EUKA|eukprot:JAP90498.1 Hypothetical protein TPC1_30007 [Trepomonas sp. PC1]